MLVQRAEARQKYWLAEVNTAGQSCGGAVLERVHQAAYSSVATSIDFLGSHMIETCPEDIYLHPINPAFAKQE